MLYLLFCMFFVLPSLKSARCFASSLPSCARSTIRFLSISATASKVRRKNLSIVVSSNKPIFSTWTFTPFRKRLSMISIPSFVLQATYSNFITTKISHCYSLLSSRTSGGLAVSVTIYIIILSSFS